MFNRTLDIGITEYLPAIPVQMGETDTSRYADIDFILHFCDVVGIYAELGLDSVSKYMWGDSLDHHKSYFDRDGNQGVNYPVHEQLARHFRGEILTVDRSSSYDDTLVKLYAVRSAPGRYFFVILNKDVEHEATIRVAWSIQELTIRIPPRSYTSLIVSGNQITVSGIGN